MDSKKYIGMDVHKESISIAVMNGAGKFVMECVIETKASTILQFIQGLSGSLMAINRVRKTGSDQCAGFMQDPHTFALGVLSGFPQCLQGGPYFDKI